MSCSCCQVSWVTMLIIWFCFIWRTLHNIHWLHCSCTFYCPVDCCCCWDSILWLRFTTLCRTVATAKHYERWSRCYAPELLNSSDLHFMIANITESLPLQINLGQPPGPLTQGIVMTSDWSSQSTICLLIGQYRAETSLTCILNLVTLPFQLNPIQLITYPRTFWSEHKKPGLCKTWCNTLLCPKAVPNVLCNTRTNSG